MSSSSKTPPVGQNWLFLTFFQFKFITESWVQDHCFWWYSIYNGPIESLSLNWIFRISENLLEISLDFDVAPGRPNGNQETKSKTC